MQIVHSLDEMKSIINEQRLTLLYISRPDCSVCHGLLPQVEQVLNDYPVVTAIHASAEEVPEVAAEYSIFTVPVIIVFADGKEMFRKARFVPIEEFRSQLSKLITLMEI
ncbi:MAG TPA: thioredoxin family protein [Chondromyces sp.]|nr:thioredoxin family protein [Chondromyces sp.]